MNLSKTFRFLSTAIFNKQHITRLILQNQIKMSTNTMSVANSVKEKEMFQEAYPSIIHTLVNKSKFSAVPEVGSWVKKVLDYNLAGGKKARGLTTVSAYEMLEKPENITEENIKLACIMGWCVEMLQAYLLVLDDLMDGSTTRRGVPCWYRLPEVGLGVINDAIIIYSSLFQILRNNFVNSPHYTDIVEKFNETLLYTCMGQHLDYTTARNKNDYSLFTLEKYEAIIKYKTAYYTYNLPICLGMYLANISDEELHEKSQTICLELGKLFQMQDDFIDCYSDESVSGKMGTDIQEGKCSWLAVTALQLCDANQRALFEENYGSKEPEKVERIKELYEKLRIPAIYREHEQAVYDDIVGRINGLHFSRSQPLFLKLADMIYKRKK